MASVTTDLINKAKLARRITTTAFDTQVEDLLNAAFLDLGIAGVVLPAELDAICEQAALTYFMANFGEPENYERLKKSYDEQKAQLSMASGYTDWAVVRDA